MIKLLIGVALVTSVSATTTATPATTDATSTAVPASTPAATPAATTLTDESTTTTTQSGFNFLLSNATFNDSCAAFISFAGGVVYGIHPSYCAPPGSYTTWFGNSSLAFGCLDADTPVMAYYSDDNCTEFDLGVPIWSNTSYCQCSDIDSYDWSSVAYPWDTWNTTADACEAGQWYLTINFDNFAEETAVVITRGDDSDDSNALVVLKRAFAPQFVYQQFNSECYDYGYYWVNIYDDEADGLNGTTVFTFISADGSESSVTYDALSFNDTLSYAFEWADPNTAVPASTAADSSTETTQSGTESPVATDSGASNALYQLAQALSFVVGVTTVIANLF